MKRYCDHCNLEVEFKEYRGNSHAILWGNSHAILRDNSHADLWDNSHADLWDNSHADLRGNSHADLWGNSYAILWGNSHADLRDNSHADLWGNSYAILWGNSHADLRDNSHADLWDNSHADLWDNSHADLWGNSYAILWGNSHAQCKSPYACGILKSMTAQCTGRSVGGQPLTAKEYLQACGIEQKNQYIILFKSVRSKTGTSFHSDLTRYIIGKKTIAPDWDATFTGECGCGLHLCPTIQQAIAFNNDGNYLACRVNVKDIASLPAFAQYPDKIRVRACTPIYHVDKDGNKI